MAHSIDQVISAAVEGGGEERVVTLPAEFQGLPETAHGGSVLAVLDSIAGLDGARDVNGIYRRRVPLGVPLSLAVRREDDRAVFALRDGRGVLVDGTVTTTAADAASESSARPAADLRPLPIARACLACGLDNPIGLRVKLGFDDEAVGAEIVPREIFHRADGTVTPLALTTLVDEAAFWLGALATGESGMTTDLAVTLHRPARAGARLVVSGARAATAPFETDPRYWRTVVIVRDEGGELIASARITFVAVRGTAKRLALAMLTVNPPDVVRGVFPAYV